MTILTIILLVYGVTVTLCLIGVTYEWLRYDSGLFKPKHHIAHCVRRVRHYKNEMDNCIKFDDMNGVMKCADSLDYWKTELRRSIRYYRKHKG